MEKQKKISLLKEIKTKKLQWGDLTPEERDEYINQDCNKGFSRVVLYGTDDVLSMLLSSIDNNEDYDIDRRIALVECLEELHHAIDCSLSKKQRKVIRLHLKGFSYVEIAEKMDTTSNAVYCTMQRSKAKLRSKLKKKLES